MVIVAFRDITEDNAIGPSSLAFLAEVVGPEEVAVVVVAAAK